MSRTLVSTVVAIAVLGFTTVAHAGQFMADFNDNLVPSEIDLDNDAKVEDGVLKLLEPALGGWGSAELDNLDPGQSVKAFTAKWEQFIGGGTGADGISFNFSNAGGFINEDGEGDGVIVTFDTFFAPGPDDPDNNTNRIGAYFMDTEVALTAPTTIRNNGWVNVMVEVDMDGRLTVDYDGSEVINVLLTDWIGHGRTDWVFAYGARQGASSDNHWLDNLMFDTTVMTTPDPPDGDGGEIPEPTSAMLLGLAGAALLRRRRR